MSNTTELITLLDALDALPQSVALRSRSYDLLRLDPGAAVVDVGCGTGRAVAELAERGARAIGVDLDEEMITVARGRWPGADFRGGNAYDLPLGGGEVAGYRAEKVFHDLADAGRALGEAARVLAAGGRVVLVGQDWDTFVIDSDDAEATRAIVHARADLVTAPRSARRYRGLLLDAGFGDVEVEVHTVLYTGDRMLPMLAGMARAALSAGAVTPGRHDSWLAEQSERARQDRAFLALPLFLASATRPGHTG
ncbi:methyltransferase domain-containing protein [Nonomuraea sp. NPDC047897]|uniref:methyltransferase domain-containing protein n=1 Tax=Nonomuraea sp. NPDC047897 TaxID=3364346 RepID=UPI00371A3BE2